MEKETDSIESRLMRLTKAQLVNKIQNERIHFRNRIDDEQEKVKNAIEGSEKQVKEVKQAMHNLISMVARTYGTQNPSGDYEIKIPVPEGGWITTGMKQGDSYVIAAKKID